ncbi:hypothetical protein GW17_00017107 [Ensete ventricosum]|nr:hypothetical protein GW17_00017107 [Ensete ventricosum]
MSKIELRLSRPSRVYRRSIVITATGTVNLQIRAGVTGVIDSLYGVVKPIRILRCLVFLRYDEAAPRSPTGRRGVASFSRWKTRCRLVLPLEDDVSPCLPSLGRGAASFFCWKVRQRLVFQLWDEALPRSFRAGTRCCLVFFNILIPCVVHESKGALRHTPHLGDAIDGGNKVGRPHSACSGDVGVGQPYAGQEATKACTLEVYVELLLFKLLQENAKDVVCKSISTRIRGLRSKHIGIPIFSEVSGTLKASR